MSNDDISDSNIVDLTVSPVKQNMIVLLDDDDEDNGYQTDDVDIISVTTGNHRTQRGNTSVVIIDKEDVGNIISADRNIMNTVIRKFQEDMDREVAMEIQRQDQEQDEERRRILLQQRQHYANNLASSSSSRVLPSSFFNNPMFHNHNHNRVNISNHIHNMNITGDSPSYEQLLELGDRMGAVKIGLSEADIAMLPLFPYRRKYIDISDDISDDKSCPICLTEFENGDMVIILNPCLHRFHETCAKKWLRENKSCPVCRENVVVS